MDYLFDGRALHWTVMFVISSIAFWLTIPNKVEPLDSVMYSSGAFYLMLMCMSMTLTSFIGVYISGIMPNLDSVFQFLSIS